MSIFLKAAFALCAFFIPGVVNAQMTADPVSWTATVKRQAKSYEIRISATLKPGWHIYAMEPGGDGTLIPTSFSFKAASGGNKPGPVKAAGKPDG